MVTSKKGGVGNWVKETDVSETSLRIYFIYCI